MRISREPKHLALSASTGGDGDRRAPEDHRIGPKAWFSTPPDQLDSHQVSRLHRIAEVISSLPALSPSSIRRSGEHHTEAFEN